MYFTQQTFARYFTRSNTELLFTILRQMIHEELALRRNRARTMGEDDDRPIDKVEISEPEFAKKVCGTFV